MQGTLNLLWTCINMGFELCLITVTLETRGFDDGMANLQTLSLIGTVILLHLHTYAHSLPRK